MKTNKKIMTVILPTVLLFAKCGIVTQNGNVNSPSQLVSPVSMSGISLYSTPFPKYRENEWMDYLAKIHTPRNPIGGVFTYGTEPCLSIPFSNKEN